MCCLCSPLTVWPTVVGNFSVWMMTRGARRGGGSRSSDLLASLLGLVLCRGRCSRGSNQILAACMGRESVPPKYDPMVTELSGDLRRGEVVELLQNLRFARAGEMHHLLVDKDVRDLIISALGRSSRN